MTVGNLSRTHSFALNACLTLSMTQLSLTVKWVRLYMLNGEPATVQQEIFEHPKWMFVAALEAVPESKVPKILIVKLSR